MYLIALKMLTEDKAKFIGMVLSLSLSTIIIIQQMAIFLGLMQRTYSAISDTPQAQVWVMNPSVKMIDDINPIRNIDLFRIRSITGVKWAAPIFFGQIIAKLPDGQFQNCNLIGVDSATFIGGPHTMIKGKIEDLRRPSGVIIDEVASKGKLAFAKPGEPKRPMQIGDTFELNDRRAIVVGICRVIRTFRAQPVIYATYDNALNYSPIRRSNLSFILAAPNNNITAKELARRIESITEFKAYTKSEFEDLTINYYLKNTGIPINFGIAVILGLLVGAAISGQIFFNFTTDNLKYYALFNVVGASRFLLAKIVLIQALWVAFLGWGIGSGLASFIGFATQRTELAFFLPWELFLGTGILILTICIVSSLISIRRIFKIQLGSMFT